MTLLSGVGLREAMGFTLMGWGGGAGAAWAGCGGGVGWCLLGTDFHWRVEVKGRWPSSIRA